MTRQRKGEGTIAHLKDGTYRVGIDLGTRNGKRIRRTARAKTRREAERKLEQLRRDWSSRDIDATRDTLDTWLAAWLDDHRADIRASTWESYAGHVRLHIGPLLGGIRLGDLTAQDVKRLKADRLRAGLAPATVARILTTLGVALNAAVDDGHLTRNPADSVKLPRVERQPVQAMTPDDAAAIVKAVKGSHIEHLVRLLLGSGLRLGEAVGLDWGDVHEADGYVVVRRSKTTPRAVPVSASGCEAVAALRATVDAHRRRSDMPVFTGERRKRQRLRKDSALHHFQRLMTDAGLPRYRLHDLRHGVATMLVAQGVHMKVVQQQLGHRSYQLTADTYSHVVPQHQQQAVRVLDKEDPPAI